MRHSRLCGLSGKCWGEAGLPPLRRFAEAKPSRRGCAAAFRQAAESWSQSECRIKLRLAPGGLCECRTGGIEKLLFYSHFGLALLYLILGAAVGGCARAFTGRGGAAIAIIAFVVTAAYLGVSHLIYAQDIMTQAQASGDLGAGESLFSIFPVVMGQLKFIHWAFVAGSLLLSVRTAGLK